MKVSDASASAGAGKGERRVRRRGEQVSPLLLRGGCSYPIVISRPRESPRHYGISARRTATQWLVGCRIKKRSPRFVSCGLTLPFVGKGCLSGGAARRNDARRR